MSISVLLSDEFESGECNRVAQPDEFEGQESATILPNSSPYTTRLSAIAIDVVTS
jgi:hypothetical protein